MIRYHLPTALALALVAAPLAAQQAAPEAGAAAVPERTANDGNVILSGIPELPAEISERLQPYHNTRSASLGDWTPDGGAIYITTRFATVPQLHLVDMPGGARRQLTFADEPIRGPTRRPGGAELLYGSDEGGGEFFQYYLLYAATGRSRRLTDGRSRNTSAAWSADGARLAFTSTRRDGRSNDVWVMEVDDTASARVVVESPDGTGWAAADWDPAGDRLLIANYISITDIRTHLLDLATGELERLAGGPDRSGAYIPAAFAPDGAGIFVITDEGGEFSRLGYMPLPAGPIEILTGDIDWNVAGFTMSRDRRRAAFTTNEGGISRLYLFDPATRRYELVENVPIGIVSVGEFSPDGRRLALTLNSVDSPSDVYTLELADDPLGHGELTRWTYSEVGGLDPAIFVAPELIDYPTFDDRRIPAFVYRPRGEGPHPVVIRIHGGPESQSRPGFSSLFQSWINEVGVAVIDPNVRGSSGYGRTYVSLDDGMLREDAVRDIGALLDWITTQPDLDEDRVMVYGGSYGGYMVLASLMHYSDRLRGGVNIVGISDFISFLENTESYRRDLRRAEYGDERDPEMRAFFERISPLRNADRITAPLFVIHGQNDPRVPVTEAEQIVRRVRANGRSVWYMNALNEGHGFSRRENQDLMRDLVVLFFQEHLLPTAEQAAFWDGLQSLCGQAFEGRLIEAPPADGWWEAERLTMHVRECDENEVRIPLHVDGDRSRTWVVSRSAAGLRLKHDHRERDGSPDASNTDYGGDTRSSGTAQRQEFPADDYSIGVVPARVTQHWYLELRPGEEFVYGLLREETGLRYRVEFDLTRPVPAPPPPWGADDAASGSPDAG